MSEPPLAQVRAVADSLLYEGYVLYPYRASSQKNVSRWQFGVLVPPSYREVDPSERSTATVECLVDGAGDRLEMTLRFLHVRRPDGPNPWDTAADRELGFGFDLSELLHMTSGLRLPFAVAGQTAVEADGTTWTCRSLDGAVTVSASVLDGPHRLVHLRIAVDNLTPVEPVPASRHEALIGAFVSAHAVLTVTRARFLSLADPPQWAAPAAARCAHDGWWPCLAGPEGEDRVVLAAPIIVEDHPRVAPESPGDLFDATEIDEILILRTMALTEEEKREARATDPRAAAVIDRVDDMPAEALGRLHGTMREGPGLPAQPSRPWWTPEEDATVDPARDGVLVGGVVIRQGSRVRMRPRARGADAQDMFVAGRTARVEAVFRDVEGRTHVAVLPESPGGALVDHDPQLDRGPGRFLFFAPDELEPELGSP